MSLNKMEVFSEALLGNNIQTYATSNDIGRLTDFIYSRRIIAAITKKRIELFTNCDCGKLSH